MDDKVRAAVAEAILNRGSPDFTMSDGPMLDLLTKIAERGDLTAFAEACDAYLTAVPASRRVLEDHAPAKILSGYLCRQPGVDQAKADRLRTGDPQWAVRIGAALRKPLTLKAVAADLLDQLRALSARGESGPSPT
jgi:hypothetical protein